MKPRSDGMGNLGTRMVIRNTPLIRRSARFLPLVGAIAICGIIGSRPALADPMTDAQISNLQQEAAMADQKASMARNPAQQQRWENTAQSFRDRAAALQTQEDSVNNTEQQIQNTLNQGNGGGN